MCDSLNPDGEYCRVWSEGSRIARKPHVCHACHGTIAKGDAYLTHANLYDGHWTSESMCFECWAAREQLSEAHRGQSVTPSSLTDTLQMCIDEGDVPEEESPWTPVLDAVLAKHGRARP